jgi:tetratricopeptide (TPR) repeat protein
MSDAPSVARESTGKRIVSGPADRTPRIWESRIEDALAIWLAAEMHRLVRGWGNPPAVILNTLERQCWNLVDPDRPEPATEDEVALALRLTRAAIELEPDEPAAQQTHAWALFANGKYDESILASRRALELADEDRKSDFQRKLGRLLSAVRQQQAKDAD